MRVALPAKHNLALPGLRRSSKACGVQTPAARRAMSADRVFSEAMDLIKRSANSLPGLVVLDLDYTIWPFWCEMYSARDTSVATLFPETRQIIEACKASGIRMAVASRSPTEPTARAFLKKLGLSSGYFEETLIIPYTQKDETHFPRLHKRLGVKYSDMLFFDDENMNIRRVSQLGVTSVLVSTSDGVSLRSFKKGLEMFAKQNNLPRST